MTVFLKAFKSTYVNQIIRIVIFVEEKPQQLQQLIQQNNGCPQHGDDECVKLLTQPIANYCPGIIVVELNRKPGSSLGLGIAGGVDKKCPPIISCIKSGSITHRFVLIYTVVSLFFKRLVRFQIYFAVYV